MGPGGRGRTGDVLLKKMIKAVRVHIARTPANKKDMVRWNGLFLANEQAFYSGRQLEKVRDWSNSRAKQNALMTVI